MPNKELLLQYATLKEKQKAIETEIEMLKESVLAEIRSIVGESDQNVALEGRGTFVITKKKKWEYSDLVKRLERELKNNKDDEERTGEARFTIQEILMYKAE